MNVGGKGIYVFGIGIALLSLVLERQVRSQNPTPPLGPNDEFTVAVNTSTIEAGPVFVADAGPQGPDSELSTAAFEIWGMVPRTRQRMPKRRC